MKFLRSCIIYFMFVFHLDQNFRMNRLQLHCSFLNWIAASYVSVSKNRYNLNLLTYPYIKLYLFWIVVLKKKKKLRWVKSVNCFKDTSFTLISSWQVPNLFPVMVINKGVPVSYGMGTISFWNNKHKHVITIACEVSLDPVYEGLCSLRWGAAPCCTLHLWFT